MTVGDVDAMTWQFWLALIMRANTIGDIALCAFVAEGKAGAGYVGYVT